MSANSSRCVSFDIPKLVAQPFGMQIYIENVLSNILGSGAKNFKFKIFCNGGSGRDIHEERLKLVDPARIAGWHHAPIPMRLQNVLLQSFGLNLFDGALRQANIIHSLSGRALPKYSGSVIATIQDVIPLRLNEGSSEYIASVKNDLRLLSNQSRAIITISEFSKLEICDILNVPADKVVVIPNGVNHVRYFPSTANEIVEARESLEALKLTRPYVLVLGGSIPRKNGGRAVEAFSYAKETFGLEHLLVFAGAKTLHADVVESIKRSKYKDEIKHLSYVDDRTAVFLLKSAAALYFPSTYEGFGLPPLEAMACGVPVAMSNVSSMPEVGGEAALFFDPLAIEDMAQALNRVLTDDSQRSICIERGLAQAQKFSWEKNARDTIKLYESVL